MAKYWTLPKDLHKKYKFVVGKRGNYNFYTLYIKRTQVIETLGEYMVRGFAEPLKPEQESGFHREFVDMLIAQEQFREPFIMADMLFDKAVEILSKGLAKH